MEAHLSKLLPRSQFARRVSMLVGGTVAGRAAIVAISPLLTRLYSPEDFGLLAVFAAFTAGISVVASLRYELAIPLPESDKCAADVAVLSVIVALSMTAFTAIVLAVCSTRIVSLFNTPKLAPYIWLIPLGVLLVAFYQILTYWAIRTKSFAAIAHTKLTQALGLIGVQLGASAFGPIALLVGYVTGHGAGITSLLIRSVRQHWSLFRTVNAGSMLSAAIRWRRLPLYSTWGGAFNAASTQLPTLLLAMSFGPATAGVFMLAERVLKTPMALVGQAVSQVFLQQAPGVMRQRQLAPLVANLHRKLAVIAMPPSLIMIISGPDLFALVFGEQWRGAGAFARWMAPWMYMSFVTSPLSTLIVVAERQAIGAVLHFILLTLSVGGLAWGASTGSVTTAIAMLSVGSALGYCCFLAYIIHTSGNRLSLPLQHFVRAFGTSIGLVSPLAACYAFNLGGVAWIAALATCIVMIGARYMFLFKEQPPAF